MQLSNQQNEAAAAVGAWLNDPSRQVFYLAGYAGTGKTTIAKYLAEQSDGDYTFMAYTGKAASVLTKKGCPAGTIHSSIYKLLKQDERQMRELKEKIKQNPSEDLKNQMAELSRPRFGLNEDSIVGDLDLVILDEVSMVNETIALDLLSFGTKLLVLGDPGQLPPVGGEGYFTKNQPDFMLTEIHRQAQDSPIIRMATRVRNGQGLPKGSYGPGCEVVDGRTTVVDFTAYDQVIVGLNRSRQLINSQMRRGSSAIPEQGEKLICLRNNVDLGLLNGTQWEVTEPPEDKGMWLELMLKSLDIEKDPVRIDAHPLDVDYRSMLPYERRRWNEFDYGYAITCHKAQGSQWPSVLLRNESYAFRADAVKWLYTALTRAEEKVTVMT